MVTSSADFVQEDSLSAGRLQNGVIRALNGPVDEETRYGNWRKEGAACLPLRNAVTGKHALIVPERTDNLELTRRFAVSTQLSAPPASVRVFNRAEAAP
ncbi:hypothetical protein [Candidatus Mycolicibacterium alkanivorans]|uniref:Uncharacterized protein n=1 Tax=Candidatus Mycolicibacterium alkanivorans TaxID=2954114 RepID=A0ABS9YUG7_9MYCO|nr:hypothetical protein [Candidatus Mycolicibacterium alkanivorans]MCI4674792.1 hypothetical protein [Candidatus Mycolicibacterium alkanivorans]